ncbi:MAG: formate dehydrogenase accessory protein FdhE [Deltaproteobacteria bacterium]|nr:formate dehydrogenase accessory protein FdhE [Deltaproteobacteria bacterium]
MTDADAAKERIQKACREVTAARPAYTEILKFYEAVFLAQEEAKAHTHVPRIDMPEDILAMKLAEKFPLVAAADFEIDLAAATRLLEKLCEIAGASASADMKEAARMISESLGAESLKPKDLFDLALGKGTPDKIPSGVSADMALLFGYNSIRPSLRLCSEQLAASLTAKEPWRTGYCPICGSSPGLSMLKGEGERWYVCSFCWHEWLTPRIYCPFCDNTDSSQLHYFFSDQEPEYRVDGCDRCSRYIKTIDLRKTSRTIVPVVEAIATLHLDLKAGDSSA